MFLAVAVRTEDTALRNFFFQLINIMKKAQIQNQVLTADTITDDQIRALRLSLARELADEGRLLASAKEWERAHAQYKLCDLALGRVRNYLRVKGGKRVARARCAEILNARGV